MNSLRVWQGVAIASILVAGVEGYFLLTRETVESRQRALRTYRKTCVDQLMGQGGMPLNMAVDSCSCGEDEFLETRSVSKGIIAAVNCKDVPIE